MTDDWYKPDSKPAPPKAPRPTKRLWEIHNGFDTYTCDLVLHDQPGAEARISKNREWFVSRRFDEGWQTLQWAELEKEHIEKGGLE